MQQNSCIVILKAKRLNIILIVFVLLAAKTICPLFSDQNNFLSYLPDVSKDIKKSNLINDTELNTEPNLFNLPGIKVEPIPLRIVNQNKVFASAFSNSVKDIYRKYFHQTSKINLFVQRNIYTSYLTLGVLLI